ncbi:MAG: type II toxin-antitoxin system HicA family toxin [bacterium]
MRWQDRLPVVSGEQVIKALEKFEYKLIHQKGSHVKMRKFYENQKHTLTIPKHKELDRGTLSTIINKVGLYIDKDKFLEMLKR